jgi:beta-catenin-like protein 1
VIKCEKQISKEKARLDAEDEPVDEEEFFLRRLSSGLFSLQQIDQVIILLCAEATGKIITSVFKVEQDLKAKICKLISMRSSTVNHHTYLRKVIRELVDNEPDEEEKETLLCLLEQF